jgi:hypothetical protein
VIRYNLKLTKGGKHHVGSQLGLRFQHNVVEQKLQNDEINDNDNDIFIERSLSSKDGDLSFEEYLNIRQELISCSIGNLSSNKLRLLLLLLDIIIKKVSDSTANKLLFKNIIKDIINIFISYRFIACLRSLRNAEGEFVQVQTGARDRYTEGEYVKPEVDIMIGRLGVLLKRIGLNQRIVDILIIELREVNDINGVIEPYYIIDVKDRLLIDIFINKLISKTNELGISPELVDRLKYYVIGFVWLSSANKLKIIINEFHNKNKSLSVKGLNEEFSDLVKRIRRDSLERNIEDLITELNKKCTVFVLKKNLKYLNRIDKMMGNLPREYFKNSFINKIFRMLSYDLTDSSTNLKYDFVTDSADRRIKDQAPDQRSSGLPDQSSSGLRDQSSSEALDNSDDTNKKDVGIMKQLEDGLVSVFDFSGGYIEDNSIKNKLSNSKLVHRLHDIINGPLSNVEKQIKMEESLLNYELEWFNHQMSSGEGNPSFKSILLHDVYAPIESKINGIIQRYTANKFRKLIKGLDSVIEKDRNEAVCALVFIYLGSGRLINVCFSRMVSLLFSGEHSAGINRTKLLFDIAQIVFKMSGNLLDKDIENENRKSKVLPVPHNQSKEMIKLIEYFNLLKIKDIILNRKPLDEFYLGDTLLNIILKECNVFNTEVIIGRSVKDKEIIVNIRDDYRDKLAISTLSIGNFPMLVKGRGLINEKYMPYYLDDINNVYNTFDSIIKNKYDNKYKTQNERKIYSSINFLNNVGFKINAEVLGFVLKEWSNPHSVFFKGYNQLEILNKEDSKEIKISKRSHNSKYWNYFNTIAIACLFKDVVFYLPTFADFRGRIYPLSSNLNYQGDDLNRALLLFAGSIEEISDQGIETLYSYYGNLCDKSKLSYNAKIDWIIDNEEAICNSMFDCNSKAFENFVSKLDEPFQFLSITLAMKNLRESKENKVPFYCSNPVLFDATCNGIQHLSALTRELEIAHKVNVVAPSLLNDEELKDKVPEDFYSYATELIHEELKNLPLEFKYENIRKIKLSRSLIKKSVMTIPYNVSLTGVGEQINEHFKFSQEGSKKFVVVNEEYSYDDKKIFLTPSEFGIFTKIIYQVLTQKMPSLKALTDYLNELVKVLLRLDLPIVWITPAGLKINLSTLKFRKVLTHSKLIKSSKPVTISLPTNDLNKIKIKRSFMPNLIHSLDASNIHLLIDRISKDPTSPIKNLYTIHDCFATTPNNMNTLNRLVKLCFIKIYFSDNNYLIRMHESIVDQIKSFAIELIEKEGDLYIKDEKGLLKIPRIPSQFISDRLRKQFIDGILNSIYFIK